MEFYPGQREGVHAIVKEALAKKCDYIRFTMSDIHGIPRGKMIPVRHLEEAAESGLGIYCGTCCLGVRSEFLDVKEAAKWHYGNALMVPVAEGFQVLPWAGEGEHVIGQCLCEPFWQDRTQQVANPRYMARQQLARLKGMGYSLYSAAEFEFQVADEKSRKLVNDLNEVYNQLVLARHEKLLIDLEKSLSGAGIDVEDMEVEYGAGQFEITMKPSTGIQAADKAFMYKLGVKETCLKKGLVATFMSKAFPGFVGNGFHFNHSLWDENKKNVFYDPSKPDNLSDVARYWVGGIMKHLGALCALQCPTINCHRRLHQPWAPDKQDWGVNNRLASVRVKNIDQSQTYVENRLPTGVANPYVVLASTCAAGIDGILNKIEPPPENDTTALPLPSSLPASLKCLKEDKILCEALGEEFVGWFLGSKEQEIQLTGTDPTDPNENEEEAFKKERNMYFEYL